MVFITAPFLSAYSYSSVIGVDWINVNTKPKTELNTFVFMQKWSSVNRAFEYHSRPVILQLLFQHMGFSSGGNLA